MDIAAWLRSPSLERYAPAFRDHAIDTEILPASRAVTRHFART